MSLEKFSYIKSITSIVRRQLASSRDILPARPLSRSIPILSLWPRKDFSTPHDPAKSHEKLSSDELHDRSEGPKHTGSGTYGTGPGEVLLGDPYSSAVSNEDLGASKNLISKSPEIAIKSRKISAVIEPNNPNAAGLSERQYARWKAVTKRSQIHKDSKVRRREQLYAATPADWRDGFKILKTRTRVPDNTRDTVRRVWRGSGRRPITQLRAESIPRPAKWSIITFKNYIEDLATSRVSPLRHRQLYKDEHSHRLAVAEQLRRVFGDTRLEHYWSVEACNIALTFFYRHSLLKRARALYAQMEDNNFLTSTETLNIILMAAASRKNLAQFQNLLEAMLKRGLKPDARTWEAFFLVNTSDRIRHQLYQSMRDRGLLNDPHTMKNFLTLNIREAFCTQLNKGHSVKWFLEYMDKLDNVHWLSPSVGNVLIHEVGKRGSAKDAAQLLGELENRGMEFDAVTLRTLLHLCLPDRNHDLAIHFLYCSSRHKIYPDKVTYETMLRQFWRSRLCNCTKVAWRYACVEGQASSAMRNLVGKGIMHEPQDRSQVLPLSNSERWKSLVGAVVLGVEMGLPRALSRPGSILIGQEDAVREEAAESRGRTSVKARLEQDLASAHQYSIDRGLPDLLNEALAMDRQWAHERVWQDQSLHWLVENSIPVKLKQTFPGRFLPPDKRDPHSYFPAVSSDS